MHKKKDDMQYPIGICSYQKGVGVTHLALSLATYFSSKQGKKVWYLEVGNQFTIENLREPIKGRYLGKDGQFQAEHITFFPNLQEEKVLGLMASAPGIIIIDFGQLSEGKEELLKLCPQRWLVCDIALWKQEQLVKTLNWKKNEEKLWNRCVCFFGKKQRGKITRQIGEKIWSVPQVSNPFCMSREEARELLGFLHKTE